MFVWEPLKASPTSAFLSCSWFAYEILDGAIATENFSSRNFVRFTENLKQALCQMSFVLLLLTPTSILIWSISFPIPLYLLSASVFTFFHLTQGSIFRSCKIINLLQQLVKLIKQKHFIISYNRLNDLMRYIHHRKIVSCYFVIPDGKSNLVLYVKIYCRYRLQTS